MSFNRQILWAWSAAILALSSPVLAAAGPDDLQSQVVGVVGSGPLLSLMLRAVAGQPVRVLSQGDVYGDGWALTTLTPSVATLTRGGESRSIGLNPTGALDQASAGPPSQVSVALSAADLARLEVAAREGWDGKPVPGLTLEETQRSILYTMKLEDLITASRAGAAGGPLPVFGDDDIRAALGEAAWADRQALLRKAMLIQRQAALDGGDINRVRVLDGLPAIGPDSIHVPAGSSMAVAAKAAGLVSASGYSLVGPPDASGGRTMTKTPPQFMTPLAPAN